MKNILLCWLILAFLAACAHNSPRQRPMSDEELLRERAALLWEAKKKNDLDTVKTFVDPEIRSEVDAYIDSQKSRSRNSKIISYTVRSLEIEGDKALVITDVSSLLTHPLLGAPTPFNSTVRDRWVKRNGVWYVIVVKPDLRKILELYQQQREEQKSDSSAR